MKDDHQLFPHLANRAGASDFAKLAFEESSANILPQLKNPPAQITISEQIQLSLSLRDPNLFLMQNFISAQECSELIAFAESKLISLPANIIDVNIPSKKGENSLLSRIEHRLAKISQTAPQQWEGIQLVMQEPVNKFSELVGFQDQRVAKDDFFLQSPPISAGGNRIASVIIYLNTPYSGGCTIFPELNLSFAPRLGYACYFTYLNEHKQFDLRLKYLLSAPQADHEGNNGKQWLAITRLRQAAQKLPL